jgi:hypothetical protein
VSLRSKRANRIPGSTLRVLTAPATDTDGVNYPKGTEFQPQSFGEDWVHGRVSRVAIRTARGSWLEVEFAL